MENIEKIDFAIQESAKRIGKRQELKQMLKNVTEDASASMSLAQLKTVAFDNTSLPFQVDPLPINDETIAEFLSDDEKPED